MDAFAEILSGVVRFGEHCHKFGDPYEGAVTFSSNKGFATLKALVVPKKYSLREARDIYDIVHLRCRELGLEPIFERIR